MSSFLELCQKVARESGTVSGVAPSAVTSQTGRLAKVVYWTQEAWRQIQTSKSRWLWMRGEYGAPDAVSTANTARYTAASWNLTRLAEWIIERDTVTMYLQSDGVSDEGELPFLPFDRYRARYERGTQTAGKPVVFSISPANEFCLGPKPDDTYVLRGMYQKSPQSLAANGDIPEMPARFHDLIVWNAVLLLAEHDEAVFHTATAKRKANALTFELQRDQLPKLVQGGPLA